MAVSGVLMVRKHASNARATNPTCAVVTHCHTLRVQVITAVAAIEFSTRYSKACCQLMVENGGVTALLEFMRSCNRSKPHMEMLGHALACLANICRCASVFNYLYDVQ
jgi:hypothetical protein